MAVPPARQQIREMTREANETVMRRMTLQALVQVRLVGLGEYTQPAFTSAANARWNQVTLETRLVLNGKGEG